MIVPVGATTRQPRVLNVTRWRNVMTLINRLRAFLRSESGQDLLEYAMLVALIAIVCYVAVESAGSAVFNVFNNIATALNGLPIGGGS